MEVAVVEEEAAAVVAVAARHLREGRFQLRLLPSPLALHLALQPRHVAAALVRLAQLRFELQQTAADTALGAEAERLLEVGGEGGGVEQHGRFVDLLVSAHLGGWGRRR